MGYRAFKMANIEDIKSFFTAKNLMSRLDETSFFKPNESVDGAIRYLRDNNYDIGIVKLDDKNYGYVLLERLKESNSEDIRGFVQKISDSEIVQADTPVPDILNKFEQNKYLFVYKDRELVGIITYADLNRPPIYAFCYLLISEFEKLLRRVVEETYSSDEWLKHLSDPHKADIGKRYILAKARGVENTLLECTTLPDLKEILLKADKWRILGFQRKQEYNSQMKKIIDFRNDVMHNRGIVKSMDGGKELYYLIDKIGGYMERISEWVNND